MSQDIDGTGAPPPAAPAAAAPAAYDPVQDTGWKLQLWGAFEAAAGGQEATCPRPVGCSGRLDDEPLPFLCPEVVVEGVGCLALPLTAAQCTELTAAATASPLAGGMSLQLENEAATGGQADAAAGTIVVAGSQVHISNCWQPVVQRAVIGTALGLQLKSAAVISMEARLRELVLRQGPCSACNLDQEGQAPGTFATLLVQLPCCGGCTGGGLEVQNLEQSFAYDFSQESDTGLHYSVHYSSCAQQQLGPLTAGRHLLLVYDLVWNGPPGTMPQPPGVFTMQQQLQAAATAWEAAIAAGSPQLRLALPLKGSYPKHSQPVSERRKPDDIFETVKVFGPPLTIDQLQGPDKAAAAALAACPALEVTLLLLFRKVHGDHGGVMSYANHKRKLPYGFDRGARKRPAGTEGLLRWRPEPVGDLPSDVDDGVDWDKVVVEEEEARKAAKPQYYADSDSDANVIDDVTHRWLRLDGSEADLGEFVADRDFWHPAGRRVVWDLVKPASEVVREERDCYYAHNGRRCSPTEESTRKYFKAFLVVTPGSHHHAAAAQGGTAAAEKQVLRLLAVVLDRSRSSEEREAAAAQAANTLRHAQSLRQAFDPKYNQWQLQLTNLASPEPAMSLLLASAKQVHAAQQLAAGPAGGQEAAAAAVPGLAALLAAMSQLVAAVSRLCGVLGGYGSSGGLGKPRTTHLQLLLDVIPLIGEEAAAAGLRDAVAEISKSNKELCLHAIKAAAAWPGVQQQMLGALQLFATPQEALKMLGSLPSLPEAQQQQVLKGLIQALQNASTRANAVIAATNAVYNWKTLPQLQVQVAAAVLEALSHLPPSHMYDPCYKLSFCGWAQWEPPLQQQLLKTARKAATALLGEPHQRAVQKLEVMCMRTQMMNIQMQQQVLEPYVTSIMANAAAFAAQTPLDCMALSNLLLWKQQPMAALHQQFAAAVLQRGDAQEVLKVLVAVGALRQPEVRGLPSVRQLLEARMAWLSQEQQRQAAAMQQQQLGVQAALQRSPWLGWTQPKAVIKGNSQLESFLRSPNSSMAMEQYKKVKAMKGGLERLCGTEPVVCIYEDSRQRPPALKGSVQTHTHSYQAEIVRLEDGRQQLVVRKTMCWLAPIAGMSKEQLDHEMEDLWQLLQQGGEGQQ